MCNSYSVTKAMLKQSKRAAGFRPLIDGEDDWKLIRPTLPGPVLRTDAGELMRWGFHRPFASSINNTRSDKLDSPMWREAFAERRCVIPMSGWYEYSGHQGNKQAHQFTSTDDTLLWAAGIWEEHATLGRCYSMIMTDANAFVSSVHHRMPLLLDEDALDDYLADGIRSFAPAAVPLTVAATANPLKKRSENAQGELF
jgi:putative SOS response-associated peptidase YedK